MRAHDSAQLWITKNLRIKDEIYTSFFESEIRRGYTLRARIPVRICRFQAVRSADARSSEMIILDAIIWIMRDASHRVEIRMARSQDNELRSESAPSSPSLSHCILFRRCCCRCFCCSCCSRYIDEKIIFDLPLLGGLSSGQAEYLDRNSQIASLFTRTNETTKIVTNYATLLLHRGNNISKDIVNFSFKLILHKVTYANFFLCFCSL